MYIFKSFLNIIVIFFSFCVSFAYALDVSSVHTVMDQILERHIHTRTVSDQIIRNSFRSYIDHFDPDRIYLLQSEVDPYLDLSENRIDAILQGYESNDFTQYQELNGRIQKAILRAREIREELMQRPVFVKRQDPLRNENIPPPFPLTVSDLKQRIQMDMASVLQQGGGSSESTLKLYDRKKRYEENRYLYQDSQGNPLPLQKKTNLFVLHLLKALTTSLDAHTGFLNASEAYEMKIRLEKGFEGVGIILREDSQGTVIHGMLEGSPAEKSGRILKGDRLLSINGINVKHAPLEEVTQHLRDAGETVFLNLKRDGKAISVMLKPDFIAINEGRVAYDFEKFDGGVIGKVTLLSFYQGKNGVTSEKDLRKAVIALKKKGPLKGLILDLRENTGGFLNQAVKVAGLFITNGVVVVSKYSDGEERYYRDMDGKTIFDGPLVVLTSKLTASAAEIVAQALQDWGKAVIVGDEKTFGKGTIQAQTVTNQESSSSHFKVTVGKYYTVSGKTPQVRGVKADIVVPSPIDFVFYGEEYEREPEIPDIISPSYKDALSDIGQGLKPWYYRYYMPTLQKKEDNLQPLIPLLRSQSEKRMAWQNRKASVDYQMEEAVNILKDMINLQKEHPNTQITKKLFF